MNVLTKLLVYYTKLRSVGSRFPLLRHKSLVRKSKTHPVILGKILRNAIFGALYTGNQVLSSN